MYSLGIDDGQARRRGERATELWKHDVVSHPMQACAASDETVRAAQPRILRRRELPGDTWVVAVREGSRHPEHCRRWVDRVDAGDVVNKKPRERSRSTSRIEHDMWLHHELSESIEDCWWIRGPMAVSSDDLFVLERLSKVDQATSSSSRSSATPTDARRLPVRSNDHVFLRTVLCLSLSIAT